MNPAEKLSAETQELTTLFARRLERLKNMPGAGSAVISEPRPDPSLLREGIAVGIDGSMDYDEHMELLLFFVVAAAYSCPFRMANGLPTFELKVARREASLPFSTVMPLWSEDLSEVDPALSPGYIEAGELAGAQRIPFALMTMAELSLAIRMLERESTAVLFLDRPLSGTYLPLARDLRLLMKSHNSVLVGRPTPKGELKWLDLVLASVLASPGTYVPLRRPYTAYAALSVAIEAEREGSELTPARLGRALSLDGGSLERTLRTLSKLNARYGGTLFSEFSPARLVLAPGVSDYWDRVIYVAQEVARSIFEGDAAHPLLYQGERWLTVLDLNALNSFLVMELAAKALSRRVLLVGLTKDTSATDYIRSAMPYLASRGSLSLELGSSSFKSDTSFLAILSAANYKEIHTPWRTPAYDSCFASVTSQRDGSLSASRGRVSRERLFVKCYFQLRSFRGDPSMRSPVFGYERPFDPVHDLAFTDDIQIRDVYGLTRFSPFIELTRRSAVDDLVLYVLLQADNPEVIEAYGHNQLLYLADKAVKAEVKLMRNALRGIAYHKLSGFERKERIFMVSRRFRELRAQAERERAGAERARGEKA